ncbi:MAG: hypothetical protein UH854_00085, partial [Clostridia bacterium]|nr:hypothetical protein [Clostridia bacterium]
SNIKYIDQKTDTDGDGSVTFTVTDTVTKLDGKKVVMGASDGSVSAATPADETVNTSTTDALLLTVDAEEFVDGLVTVYVTQVVSAAKTGVNITVTTATGTHEFTNLFNLSTDNDYAIQLIDETGEILTKIQKIVVTPIDENGNELSKISGIDYWVE